MDELFFPGDGKLFYATPIPVSRSQDKLLWHDDNKGSYLVGARLDKGFEHNFLVQIQIFFLKKFLRDKTL